MSKQEQKPERFETEWVEPPDIIPLGGKWVYAVGVIRDKGTGVLRLRIAKGRIKGYTKRNPDGVLEVFPDDPIDPITQPNRLNIKTGEEWHHIAKLVERWLDRIPAERPKPKEPAEKVVPLASTEDEVDEVSEPSEEPKEN